MPTCTCMTEDLGDGLGERVVTHSGTCPKHPDAAGRCKICGEPLLFSLVEGLIHGHSYDVYCHTGDGAMALQKKEG